MTHPDLLQRSNDVASGTNLFFPAAQVSYTTRSTTPFGGANAVHEGRCRGVRTESDKDVAQVLHCIGMTNDGLIYVCDRRAYRIQVFDKMGNFKKNIDVAWKQYTPYDGKRKTGEWGSASTLAFSRDPSQKFIYVTNEDNAQIEILDRDTGRTLTTFGRGAGHFLGQFTHAHGITIDSKGNAYIGETDEGKRVQKFKIITR
jgi:hypothetical protein